MVNQQVLVGHWNELKGQLKEKWGQLTDNELQQAYGDVDQLVGLIQRKTGEARELIETELEELVASGSSMVSRATESVRGLAENAGQRVQEGYQQVSEQVRERYSQAEQLVQKKPTESIAVAFGTGLIAGVIIGLVLRSR